MKLWLIPLSDVSHRTHVEVELIESFRNGDGSENVTIEIKLCFFKRRDYYNSL